MSRLLPFDWRRVLIYAHRWLGIGGCLLFFVWFTSGIVMMYARMPSLTAEERVAHLPALRIDRVRISPLDAAIKAGVSPRTIRIGMAGDRPVYRVGGTGAPVAVFADTGERLEVVDPKHAVAIAQAVWPEHASTLRHDAKLDVPDQWTLTGVPRQLFPLHRMIAGDLAGTHLYISVRSGEPVMKTTAQGRRWGYAGAVLHWLYFAPFRRHGVLWAQTIIWLSVAGCVMCIIGLVVGVTALRPRSPYAGIMKWHHYAGLIFGVTTFTWIFSGLLSMDPWDWHPSTAPTRAQVDAVAGGPLRFESVTVERLRAAAGSAPVAPKELELVQLRGQVRILAHPPSVESGSSRTAPSVESGFSRTAPSVESDFSRTARQFADAEIMNAAREAMAGAPIEDASWLSEYDAYYYDRGRELPLPVLRVRYSDPQRTWLYFDPFRGAIVRKEERLTRLNRWLYHGLHSLDFPFLYKRRPLWDVVVIVLIIGGLMSSITAMTPAWRRLRRHVNRLRT